MVNLADIPTPMLEAELRQRNSWNRKEAADKIGANLKSEREKRNLTQVELAKMLKCSQVLISLAESGKRPQSAKTLLEKLESYYAEDVNRSERFAKTRSGHSIRTL